MEEGGERGGELGTALPVIEQQEEAIQYEIETNGKANGVRCRIIGDRLGIVRVFPRPRLGSIREVGSTWQTGLGNPEKVMKRENKKTKNK